MTTTNAKVASRRAAGNVYRGTGHTAYAQQVTKAFLSRLRLRFHILLRFSFTFSYILHIRLVQVLKI